MSRIWGGPPAAGPCGRRGRPPAGSGGSGAGGTARRTSPFCPAGAWPWGGSSPREGGRCGGKGDGPAGPISGPFRELKVFLSELN